MSEVVLQPWMRAYETATPVPTDVERKMAYIAVRGCIENAHEKAHTEDEGDVVHMHPARYCIESLTMETDDEGGTVVLSKRTNEAGTEHTVTLTTKTTRHEYVCDNVFETLRRTDHAIDMEEVDISSLDDELAAFFMSEGIAAESPEEFPLAKPGVTVGRQEVGALIGVIAKATYLPR